MLRTVPMGRRGKTDSPRAQRASGKNREKIRSKVWKRKRQSHALCVKRIFAMSLGLVAAAASSTRARKTVSNTVSVLTMRQEELAE
jgi:hypothetical protein